MDLPESVDSRGMDTIICATYYTNASRPFNNKNTGGGGVFPGVSAVLLEGFDVFDVDGPVGNGDVSAVIRQILEVDTQRESSSE